MTLPASSSGSLNGRSEGVTRVLLLIFGAQASAEHIPVQGTKIHLIKGIFPAVPSWQLEITYCLQLPRATSWKGAHATLPSLPLTQSCTTAPAATRSEASPAVLLRSGERLC